MWSCARDKNSLRRYSDMSQGIDWLFDMRESYKSRCDHYHFQTSRNSYFRLLLHRKKEGRQL